METFVGIVQVVLVYVLVGFGGGGSGDRGGGGGSCAGSFGGRDHEFVEVFVVFVPATTSVDDVIVIVEPGKGEG